MEFRKYQHLERFGTDEVEGIECGRTYVFPKIDGTNSSLWMENRILCAGSRNRKLSLDNDNAGFYNWASTQTKFYNFFNAHPNLTLYGEWLVPHSLKTYNENAWRNFYVFDVVTENEGYLHYDLYRKMLEEFDIDYIPSICIVDKGTFEIYIEILNKNTYLIQDGKGIGEGIVIKNYGYKNKYGRTTWAKIVTNEFKEKNIKTFGAPMLNAKTIELDIVEQFCTKAFIEKELSKISLEHGGWNSKLIPKLLGTVYHELINEEMWNILKKFNNPTINFKTLNSFTTQKIKLTMPELF